MMLDSNLLLIQQQHTVTISGMTKDGCGIRFCSWVLLGRIGSSTEIEWKEESGVVRESPVAQMRENGKT